MKLRICPRFAPAAIAAVLLAVGDASAVVTSAINAFDNATVQPGGPRSGGSGKNFVNVEGDANNAFASYAVVDFNTADFGIASGSVASFNSLSLSFVQANAGFTNSGGLAFYITTDTATSIQPGSSLTYVNPSAANNNGIGGNLATLYQIGVGVFTEVASGTVDTYNFELGGLSDPAKNYLAGVLNAGGTLRVAVAPTATDTAATWSGFSGFGGSPTLQANFTPVPEPSTYAFGAFGLGLALWHLRRRRSALASKAV